MSEITKIKNGFLVECDCGATHKITKSDDELKIKSTFKKTEDVKKDAETKNPDPPKDDRATDDDDFYF